MSSSVGYGYSYVDVEAQAQRRLRVEIAEMQARAAGLQAQAVGFGRDAARRLRPIPIEIPASAGSAELGAISARLADAVETGQRAVDAMVVDAWVVRLGPAPAAGAVPAASAAEELARVRAGDGRQPAASPAIAPAAAEAALAAAESLLAREVPRCDPADLEFFQRRLADLRSATRTDVARQALDDIERSVADSVLRRRGAQQAAVARARLLALLEHVSPDDRARLRAAVSTAGDPGELTAAVAGAVARADAEREQRAVASAAADALRSMGCEVGADFATLLSDSGEAIAPFGPSEQEGYGLLVRLNPAQSRLAAAVVRSAAGTAQPDRDLEVQQGFCASGLEELRQGLSSRGVKVQESLRIEAGQVAVGLVAAERWPRQSGAASAAPSPRRRRSSTAMPRERHRER